MKKRLAVIMSGAAVATVAGLAAVSLMMAAHPSHASAATCTPTGYTRDSINLTAAEINPSGIVSGQVDATGCDIGVYYGPGSTGTVNHADIHNAQYYGVVNNGGVVTIENSSIHQIGNTPFDGDQHGVGVYWAPEHVSTGKIANNTISSYQKGGIVVRGVGSSAVISGNTVTGLGPTPLIAQNGIEVGAGATANVMDNTVSGNSYTGSDTASSGILVFGGACYGAPYGTDTQVVGNTVINNDVGVWLSNLQADCLAPTTTPTNIKVVNNTISNDSVSNPAYQAGVSDQGNNDKIIHNTISGAGYDPESSSTAYLIQIDADSSMTNHVKVHANVI